MTLCSEIIASGPGWYVQDVLCGAGPDDRPFEERHRSVCLAAVIQGTFGYRTSQGTAMLVPGAVMLGNADGCFECGHEHGVGDRCLSFHFTSEYWERLVAALPGARSTTFPVPRLPPKSSLIAVTAVLETARERSDAAFEEGALDFAGTVMAGLDQGVAAARKAPRPRGARDAARISQIVRHIEATAHQGSDATLSLGALARQAGMSPYHFLRTFRSVVGMSPYQFVLHTRLHRAAVRLRTSGDEISVVAFEAGFSDLSTFNRRFRRLMGTSPSAYRGTRH
jgi:AraC-like DNA-binding protein